MKKLLLVDVPDGIDLIKVKISDSANEYGEFSYLIPIIDFKEIQLPTTEKMCNEADNYFNQCPKGEKKNADIHFLRGANWIKSKLI